MKRAEAITLLKKANNTLTDEDFTLDAKERPKVEKWVKALRSGKYGQTNGTLFQSKNDANDTPKEDGYCCLGVYCAAVQRIAKSKILGDYPIDIGVEFPLSHEVQEALATLNDGSQFRHIRKRPFSQIANIVEAVYLA